jgi:hypothetical protein
VRRPRGAAALSTPEPLPQAWVPRVLNLAVAVLFLLLLAPAVGAWAGKPWYVQAAIVLFGTPFLLVALLCLASAARPGSLGRAARRLRRR